MPEVETIQELHEEVKKTFADFKTEHEKLEKQVTDGFENGITAESVEKLNTRLDELDAKMQRVAKSAADDTKTDPEEEVKGAFGKWLRKGSGAVFTDEEKTAVGEYEKKLRAAGHTEVKLMSTDSDPDGGFVMPRNVRADLIRRIIEVDPVRDLANVETISSGDFLDVPAEGDVDAQAEWVGERAARTETTSPDFRMDRIQVHEIYANPFITQKLLDDVEFDIVGWLTERLRRRFAVKEGNGFINGDAVGKPEGMLDNADVTEVNSGAAATLTADGLIDLFYDGVVEFYANNGSWLAKRSSIKVIRKFKDANGQYLWQPGITAGQPATILGAPVRESVSMPAIAANANPLIFGDIRAAYTIVDRQDVRVQRDPFSNKPKVEYYTTKRVGGGVVLAEAIAKQKVSA